MLKKPEIIPDEPVACSVCLKEIPRSVARSQEGSDYVLHFCGDQCFVKWQNSTPEAERADKPAGE